MMAKLAANRESMRRRRATHVMASRDGAFGFSKRKLLGVMVFIGVLTVLAALMLLMPSLAISGNVNEQYEWSIAKPPNPSNILKKEDVPIAHTEDADHIDSFGPYDSSKMVPAPDKWFMSGTCIPMNATAALNSKTVYLYPVSSIDKAGECHDCGITNRSLKFCGAKCGQHLQKDEVRQLLIVGVQRSGTHFTWEMFNRLGAHVHHEGIGPAGSISWPFSWKTNSYIINNPERLNRHRFCVVLHQVRHPLRVLSTILKTNRLNDNFWKWIQSVEPKVNKSQPLLIQGMQLWVAQNELIESYADARFRVEDTSQRDVCRVAGLTKRVCDSDGRHHTTSAKTLQPIVEPRVPQGVDLNDPTSVKLNLHPLATWEAISDIDHDLALRAKAMAERYGYDLDPRRHPQSMDTAEFRA